MFDMPRPTNEGVWFKKPYFGMLDRIHERREELPYWAFDFIGVHRPLKLSKSECRTELVVRKGWTLSCTFDLLSNGVKPYWARLTFTTKSKAVSYALSCGYRFGVHVVDCS